MAEDRKCPLHIIHNCSTGWHVTMQTVKGDHATSYPFQMQHRFTDCRDMVKSKSKQPGCLTRNSLSASITAKTSTDIMMQVVKGENRMSCANQNYDRLTDWQLMIEKAKGDTVTILRASNPVQRGML